MELNKGISKEIDTDHKLTRFLITAQCKFRVLINNMVTKNALK